MAWIWPWSRAGGDEPARGNTPYAERKHVHPASLIAVHGQSEPRWTRRDYAGLAREGFIRNPVVHRAVKLIADAAASVPWLVYDGGGSSSASIRCWLCSTGRTSARLVAHFWRRCTGICCFPATPISSCFDAGEGARELHLLRPDRVQGRDQFWRLACGAGVPAQGYGAAAHRAGPRRGWGGRLGRSHATGAVSSARRSLWDGAARGGADGLDIAQRRRPVEQGAARQFGAAIGRAGLFGGTGQPDRGSVRAAEGGAGRRFFRRAQCRAADAARRRAGLEGDGAVAARTWISSRPSSGARDIALAFGVPPMLLGIPGDNTYANLAEANRALWRQTVMPLVGKTAKELAPGLLRCSASTFGSGTTRTRWKGLRPTEIRCGRGSAQQTS